VLLSAFRVAKNRSGAALPYVVRFYPVAGLLLTTEAMVAEKPEKKKAAPAMPMDEDMY
jgi:hypothetical protein